MADDFISMLMKNHLISISNIRISYNYLLIILVTLIFMPAIGAFAYITVFGVNIPYWDEWDQLPSIQKLFAGNLALGDLFSQHNEHRIFFPNLIMVAVSYFTHHNVKMDMYVSWIFSLTTFLVIFKMYLEKFGSGLRSLALFVPVAWLFFSLIQFENLLWGWQVQIYLCVLAFILMLFFLNKGTLTSLALAIPCGLIASFSFVNGLLVWPVGLFFIVASRKVGWFKNSILWLVSGLLATGLYFYQWTHPADSPSMFYAFSHMGDAVQYMLVYVGAPLAYTSRLAMAFGIILSALLVLSIAYIIVNKKIKENSVWASLILFFTGSAILCTLGRSGFGIEQALASRYTTFTILGIIGLYLIILFCWKTSANRSKTAFAAIFTVLAILITAGIFLGYYDGGYAGIKTNADRTTSAALLKNYDNMTGDQILSISPNISEFMDDAKILYEYNLSVFHSP